jgi:hypothetical protein
VKSASAADVPKANYSYLYFEFQQPPKVVLVATNLNGSTRRQVATISIGFVPM